MEILDATQEEKPEWVISLLDLLGYLHLRYGYSKNAVTYFHFLAKMLPNDCRILRGLAVSELAVGNWEQALDPALRSLAIAKTDEECVPCLLVLASILRRRGQDAEADEFAKQYIALKKKEKEHAELST